MSLAKADGRTAYSFGLRFTPKFFVSAFRGSISDSLGRLDYQVLVNRACICNLGTVTSEAAFLQHLFDFQ